MTKTTQAMVMTGFNRPIELREFPLPSPEGGEVLVEVTAAGVCGSDVHMWRGKDPRTPLPVILGHEGVGRVAALGGGRGKKLSVYGREVKEGDLVLWHRGISCGRCYFCLVKKEPALCPDRLVYGINRGCSERPHLRGCYSRHILLDDATVLYHVDDGIDPAAIVSATCSGSTVAHAFDLVAPMAGDTVLVQGPGPLGIFAVAFARSMGAGKIIVTGGTDARLELCREFGADVLLNRNILGREERAAAVMDLTGGRGVDYAVEAAGTTDAVEEGISLVRRGGVYVSVGFGEPRGSVSLDCFRDIALKNLHLQGVWVSDARHTHMALQLIMSRGVDMFSKMVTHRLPLQDATGGLELMEQKEAVKIVLVP